MVVLSKVLKTGLITGIILFAGVFYFSNNSFAEVATDDVSVNVPTSCSLTGTINAAHTATIENGLYQENIGETTFKAFCNDAEGFAIYAVGYTDNLYGNTTMKPSNLDAATHGIVTGTATSGEISNWAMKLSAVSGTFTPTIQNSFNSYHAVPTAYTEVASFTSNTDDTIGASIKSTYATFVSRNQAADTYTGKVKYTIIHPSNASTPVETIYDANGGYFGSESNVNNGVRYGITAASESVVNPKYSHTPNISDDGTKNADYNYDEEFTTNDVIRIAGAASLDIILTYGGENQFDFVSFWEGNHPDYRADTHTHIGVQSCGDGEVVNGAYGGSALTTVECTIPGDAVTFSFISDGADTEVGYGYYAIVTGRSIDGEILAGDVDVHSAINDFGSYAIPERNNYVFLGWSDSASATTATYTSENEILSYAKKSGVAPSILYAVWGDLVSMQNASVDDCGKYMRDLRDGKIYSTISLGGKCWMTKNLDLAGGTKLYSATSNVPDGYNNTEYYQLPASSISSFSDDFTASVYNSNSVDCLSDEGCYSYYSFAAACAGNVVHEGFCEYDVCPAGWRMPVENELLFFVKNYISSAAFYNSSFEPDFAGGIYKNDNNVDKWYPVQYLSSTSYAFIRPPAYGSHYGALGIRARFDRNIEDAVTSVGVPIRCIINDRIQTVTVNIDSNISKVEFFNENFGTQTATASGEMVSLRKGVEYKVTAYANPGYRLNSWSTTANGTLNSSSANPVSYSVIENTTLTITSAESLYIYNATYADCGKTMWDNRDGVERAYTTALINGLCWMTTNLDLSGSTSLNSNTSNVATSGYTLPASSEEGFSSNTTAYVYNRRDRICSRFSMAPCTSYYSYKAACAGTSPSSGECSYSICPAGWRLPTKNDFVNLVNSYPLIEDIVAYPFYGSYSYLYYNFGVNNIPGTGSYWSSTAKDSDNAYYYVYYYLDNSDYNNPNGANKKSAGFPIRCVKSA